MKEVTKRDRVRIWLQRELDHAESLTASDIEAGATFLLKHGKKISAKRLGLAAAIAIDYGVVSGGMIQSIMKNEWVFRTKRGRGKGRTVLMKRTLMTESDWIDYVENGKPGQQASSLAGLHRATEDGRVEITEESRRSLSDESAATISIRLDRVASEALVKAITDPAQRTLIFKREIDRDADFTRQSLEDPHRRGK